MSIKQKILAEIDKRYKEYSDLADNDEYYRGMADSLDFLAQFIVKLREP